MRLGAVAAAVVDPNLLTAFVSGSEILSGSVDPKKNASIEGANLMIDIAGVLSVMQLSHHYEV